MSTRSGCSSCAHAHRRLAVLGFADDLEAIGQLDNRARHGAKRLLVVDDQNADRHLPPRITASHGRAPMVPAPRRW